MAGTTVAWPFLGASRIVPSGEFGLREGGCASQPASASSTPNVDPDSPRQSSGIIWHHLAADGVERQSPLVVKSRTMSLASHGQTGFSKNLTAGVEIATTTRCLSAYMFVHTLVSNCAIQGFFPRTILAIGERFSPLN